MPDNVIVDVIKNDFKNKTKDQRITEYSDYVNQPHVAPFVLELKNNPTSPGANDGQLLHASMSWNSHNTVPGPNPSERNDDPGSSIETHILNKQLPEFKHSVQQFQNNQSIKNFESIPKAQNVDFKYDPNLKPKPYSVL